MRKTTIILTFIIGLVLCGCGKTDESEISGVQNESISEFETSGTSKEDISGEGASESQAENISGDEMPIPQTESPMSVEVEQGGPYG